MLCHVVLYCRDLAHAGGADFELFMIKVVSTPTCYGHYAAGQTPPAEKSKNLTNTTKHPQTTWNDPKWIPHTQPGPFGIIPCGLGVLGGVCEIFTFANGW